jgi:hypothetical protein
MLNGRSLKEGAIINGQTLGQFVAAQECDIAGKAVSRHLLGRGVSFNVKVVGLSWEH